MIVSLKAFHHIPDPAGCVSLPVVLCVRRDEQKSYLNPGGRLVIADLKLDAWAWRRGLSVVIRPNTIVL